MASNPDYDEKDILSDDVRADALDEILESMGVDIAALEKRIPVLIARALEDRQRRQV